MAADHRYDEARFTELLLYVARQLHDDPECSAIKLNKALWWAECASIRMYGRSISGTEYQKLKQGRPRGSCGRFANDSSPPETSSCTTAGTGDTARFRLAARREPNLGLISA